MTNTTFSSAEHETLTRKVKRGINEKMTALCQQVSGSYRSMVNCGKLMREKQNELREKELEQRKLCEAKEILSSESKVNTEYAFRSLAYYLLPVMDTFFAFFAIRPIITSKIADLGGETFAIVVGAFMTILVSILVSLLSRIAMSSLKEENKWKKSVVLASTLLLPLMYVVGEIIFNSGKTWAFSGCFAIISWVIQLIIVAGYSNQREALNIRKANSGNTEMNRTVKNSEKAVGRKIDKIRSEIEKIKKDFKAAENDFIAGFRKIVDLRQSYKSQYGDELSYCLGQVITWLGNVICYHCEALPMRYTNGVVESVVILDSVGGSERIYFNKDLEVISYMYNEIGSENSLDEYIGTIERQRRKACQQDDDFETAA